MPERGLDRWIVGSLDEDDGIGVGIENPRTQMIKGAVEMESGMAGGETGHKDIEIGRISSPLCACRMGVDTNHSKAAGDWLTRRPPHPSNGSQVMVFG